MTPDPKDKMIVFHVPVTDVLAAIGLVSVRHSQLDRILRMTIKTITGVTPKEAIDATAYQGSSMLRERIGKLGRQALGEGVPLIRLQALLQRCKRVTEKRNDFIHSICAREWDGVDAVLVRDDNSIGPMPTADELTALAHEIEQLVNEINQTRLFGWLAEAITAKKRP